MIDKLKVEAGKTGADALIAPCDHEGIWGL